MQVKSVFNRKGITLIELMVALVICGIVMGAMYRLFITQTRAYTVQDQVAEVQQSVRSAMEILVRDLRMAGSETLAVPIVTPVASNSITVNYQASQVTYSIVGGNLRRTLGDGTFEDILPNVTNPNGFILTYGIDADVNRIVDDQNGNGVVDTGDYIAAGAVGGNRIIGIRVRLSANPSPNNPDALAQVSPRTLDSTVALRNLL